MVQWLRLHVSRAGDMGLISSWGAKVSQAVWCGQKKKKKSVQEKNIIIVRIFNFAVGDIYTIIVM